MFEIQSRTYDFFIEFSVEILEKADSIAAGEKSSVGIDDIYDE